LEDIKNIKFDNVSFKYPDSKIILKNISFEISENEKVMLVGLNGSGKTTLIKLLTRFYETSNGVIYINGLNIKEYNIKSLRSHIATVFQDFNVFSFTIRENVAIGDFDREKDDILIDSSLQFSNFNNEEYLKSRNLDLYINRDFENTGIELSGGQRQKLAISRAILRNSALIILDEPTASLDPITENEILDAFYRLYQDKILLMISHRFSSALKMDKILFIEDGEITGIDKHINLYNKNTHYRKLFDLQANAYN
jgi:ABC-type multidrug transport system fused ATPase/permease subunit